MDEAKREGLEKTHKTEKNPRVAARMLAVHTDYVRGTSSSMGRISVCLERSGRLVLWCMFGL